ncbi:lactoylglutathione lyase [Thermosporothrix hazakensis]|jgi:lactoylglutathione lyase|uniref:Lactoylglutathione lyase n=2 Tax=Thermosporothrix TaxID=768650 RepID=A0A326U6F7_THEHA|nr:VOC family protein [Thermosporothrix hazakensis]PZW29192.1 lactoylglutathione lyase [Thermosporothrix hazakensis]BBH86119.1 lactoylglutathione lyase [Thermosporothrix sp. COM3]GCE45456.1 lactoylglutathione lyase [Thermosporothrix hazakensis]
MIRGIGHLALRITNLERSLDFYCAKLGLKEVFRLDREGQPSPWIVYLQVAHNQFLELFPGEEAQHLPEGSFQHLCLVVDDMQATLKELEKRGVPIAGEPQRGLDNNWQYWLKDPDGNPIELMQIDPSSPHAAANARW